MSHTKPVLALLIALAMFALACGSDDISTVASGGSPTAPPQADAAPTATATATATTTATTTPATATATAPNAGETPIPVEPDGGIGDGAEPLPGAPQPTFEGDWHGAEVAETNCPGTSWHQVEASAFSFSVPADFVDHQAQGIDSEVGSWSNGSGIDLAFDYGWYTGPLEQFPGVEITEIDYSGISGELGIVRNGAGGGASNLVGVYFPKVTSDGGQANALGLNVWFDDAGDEIIARCIVGSIEWTAAA